MHMIRRAILAFTLIAGIAPAIAQVPAPVPALPDTERRTSYSITASKCACTVNMALYGDSTDYQNWVEVWVNGVLAPYNDPAEGWTITSPTGPLATIPRPITDAVLTFTNAQTGTIQIVGARRPRRTSQFNENAGIPARGFNQALTDIVAMLREVWDKINDVTGRVPRAPAGETMATLPPAASRANMGACFDTNGNLVPCVGSSAGSFAAGNGIAFTGTNPTTIGIASNGIVVGVSGGTTTFTSSQCGANVVRTNSGSAMQDLFPGTVAGPLPNNCKVTVTNGDAAGMLSINAASGASIKGGTASNGFLYLGPGQSATFQSDGANPWPIASPTRAKLGAATSLFVAATGSATNDGLTSATPLLDPSFTYSLLANSFDLAGNVVTVTLATGTYPQVVFDGPIVGNIVARNFNNVLFTGNPTTPANVKIADTTSINFAAINVFGGAAVTLNGFQITSVNNSDLIADLNSNVIYQNIDWHGVRSGLNHVISENGGRVTLAGAETVSSGAGCHWISGNAGQIETTGAVTPVTTITGTPAWASGYACTQYSGSNVVIQGAYTITGSATGPKVSVSGGSYINSGSLGGCGNFPGSTAGTISAVGTCQ